MARDYSSGSTTVVARSGVNTAGSGGISAGFWCNLSALGGPSSFAQALGINQSGVGDVVKFGLWDDPTIGNQRMVWNVGRTTADRQILSTRPLVATGKWQFWAGTDDGSVSAGTIHIFEGEQGVAPTNVDGTPTNGTGTPRAASSADTKIGNMWSLNNNFPGVIAHPFIVPYEMSLADITRMWAGDWTVLFKGGAPILWLPSQGASLWDFGRGGGGTVPGLYTATGTTVAAEPPVNYRWSRTNAQGSTPAAVSTTIIPLASYSYRRRRVLV